MSILDPSLIFSILIGVSIFAAIGSYRAVELRKKYPENITNAFTTWAIYWVLYIISIPLVPYVFIETAAYFYKIVQPSLDSVGSDAYAMIVTPVIIPLTLLLPRYLASKAFTKFAKTQSKAE